MSIKNEVRKLEVPKFTEISINDDWFGNRERILKDSLALETISTQEEFEKGEILLKKITSTSNKAEAKRKSLSKPFNDFAKKIKKLGDDARESLEDEKVRIKQLLTTHLLKEQEKQEEIRKQEIERLEKEEKAKEENPFFEHVQQEPEPVIEQVTETIKSFTRSTKVLNFKILNPVLVPREFCEPSEKKIRQYIKEEKENAKIEGVEIFEELKISSR